MEKVSLRTGKMLGLAACLLIFLQLPLAGRLKILDRIFSLPGLIRQHRIHAWAIAILALIHPLCVLLPEGKLIVPLEMRYWPEWIGVVLLVFILSQFVVSQWRQSMGCAFHTWMRFHRIAGLLVAGLLVVHILCVSESFSEDGLPRLAVVVAAAAFLLFWSWVRGARLRVRRKPFLVSRVEPTGSDCTCVELTPARQPLLSFVPGQFAWVSFASATVVPEAHAFTLSSTPSRPGMLQFTIRVSGDWTHTIGGLSIGDLAFIQGPFGRFGHLYADPDRELIMIAGGIGITPMLSAFSRRSAIFVCGPPQMMRQVYTDLKTIGFPARSIFTEAFGL